MVPRRSDKVDRLARLFVFSRILAGKVVEDAPEVDGQHILDINNRLRGEIRGVYFLRGRPLSASYRADAQSGGPTCTYRQHQHIA
jgi:hypothetical protein